MPNPGFHWEYNERIGYGIAKNRGETINIWQPKEINTVKSSPPSKAAVLFNKLPVKLKLKCDNCPKTYKKKLDNLLELVPDEPDSIRRAAKTNSLEHQLDYKL